MPDLTTLRLSDCWAKTWREGPLKDHPALSVRDHCLHVGAVAEALRSLLPNAVQRLLPPSAVTLTAMHDIGKLTVGFLQKSPVWKKQWLGQGANVSRAAAGYTRCPDEGASTHGRPAHAAGFDGSRSVRSVVV